MEGEKHRKPFLLYQLPDLYDTTGILQKLLHIVLLLLWYLQGFLHDLRGERPGFLVVEVFIVVVVVDAVFEVVGEIPYAVVLHLKELQSILKTFSLAKLGQIGYLLVYEKSQW